MSKGKVMNDTIMLRQKERVETRQLSNIRTNETHSAEPSKTDTTDDGCSYPG